MTITPRSVQKWVQERVQNDPYNLHAKNPCGFHATLFVQRLTRTSAGSASLDGHKGPGKPTVPGVHAREPAPALPHLLKLWRAVRPLA